MSAPAAESAAVAPADGVDDVVDAIDIPDKWQRKGRARTRRALKKIYDYLAKFGEATATDLKRVYSPVSVQQPSSGMFLDRGAWWEEAGQVLLAELPGVAAPTDDDETWRYVGVDPDEFEDTVPAGELEVSEDVLAEHVIVETDFKGYGARVDRQREALYDLWELLKSQDARNGQGVPEDQLRAEHDCRDRFWNRTGREALAEFPGVEVTTEDTDAEPQVNDDVATAISALEEIDGIEDVNVTYSVDAADQAEVWRYNGADA